ncbi:MAG: 4Fe-4S binding protein [Sedimentisphaerales bacterium]|nr:4Fe-4S binding protein [Sedimentisphaerales bacterium]
MKSEPNSRLGLLVSRWLPHRVWVQAGFLLVWLDVLGLRYHGICSPVFHCYACPLATFACPIGVLASFSALHVFPFVAIGLLLVIGGLLGSLLCGWACPFGLLQDLAAKTQLPKLELPRWAGYGRYIVLIVAVILVPYLFGEGHPLFICRICPAGGVEAAIPLVIQQASTGQQITWPSAAKIAIILGFIGSIFFIRRPWCRMFCPLGGVFGLLNKISMFLLRVDHDRCISCNRCHRLCQYNIEPEKTPNNLRCIRCLECTQCPTGAIRPGTIL